MSDRYYLQRVREDLQRLSDDVRSLERHDFTADLSNVHEAPRATDLRASLARVAASNTTLLSSMQRLNSLTPRQRTLSPSSSISKPPRSQSARDTETATPICGHRPTPPPPRRVSLNGKGGSSCRSAVRKDDGAPSLLTSPRTPVSVDSIKVGVNSSLVSSLSQSNQASTPARDNQISTSAFDPPMGSALSAVRSKAMQTALGGVPAGEHRSPMSKLRSDAVRRVALEESTDEPKVTVRIRGSDGKVNQVSQRFFPSDSVLEVVQAYFREYPQSKPVDFQKIQLFVPLMPPIPFSVMGRVTLLDAKMCPSSCVILQTQ